MTQNDIHGLKYKVNIATLITIVTTRRVDFDSSRFSLSFELFSSFQECILGLNLIL